MKRIIMMMCIALLTCTMGLKAQQAPSNNMDSLTYAIELSKLEMQYEMYCDSLQHSLDMKAYSNSQIEEIVELSIPVTFFVSIIVIIWLALMYSQRKQRERYRILEKAIDNGQSIPEGLFDEPKNGRHLWVNTLRTALIYLSLGIGAALFGWIIDERVIIAIACIPATIGLGYLCVSLIERREQQRNDERKVDATETIDNMPQNNENEI